MSIGLFLFTCEILSSSVTEATVYKTEICYVHFRFAFKQYFGAAVLKNTHYLFWWATNYYPDTSSKWQSFCFLAQCTRKQHILKQPFLSKRIWLLCRWYSRQSKHITHMCDAIQLDDTVLSSIVFFITGSRAIHELWNYKAISSRR